MIGVTPLVLSQQGETQQEHPHKVHDVLGGQLCGICLRWLRPDLTVLMLLTALTAEKALRHSLRKHATPSPYIYFSSNIRAMLLSLSSTCIIVLTRSPWTPSSARVTGWAISISPKIRPLAFSFLIMEDVIDPLWKELRSFVEGLWLAWDTEDPVNCHGEHFLTLFSSAEMDRSSTNHHTDVSTLAVALCWNVEEEMAPPDTMTPLHCPTVLWSWLECPRTSMILSYACCQGFLFPLPV